MTTLQEQFEKDFPKNIERIYKYYHGRPTPINSDLDLKEYVNLTTLSLVSIGLVSVEFLNTIPNPEKLTSLDVSSNHVQPTDIEIFSKFVNLKYLKIGTEKTRLMSASSNEFNRFYGSFKSWKNLTKLEDICIEATSVNEGLEYLPMSLAQSTAQEVKSGKIKGGYMRIECSSYGFGRCSAIQDQLRPFNYDLEAWQLAHPHKMYKAQPELFENPDSREEWLNAIITKLANSESKLNELKQNEPDKVKKIKRMELKIDNLSLIKQLLEQRTIFEDSLKTGVRWYDRFKEDKTTQTELSLTKITELEQQEQEVQKLKEKVGRLKIEK